MAYHTMFCIQGRAGGGGRGGMGVNALVKLSRAAEDLLLAYLTVNGLWK